MRTPASTEAESHSLQDRARSTFSARLRGIMSTQDNNVYFFRLYHSLYSSHSIDRSHTRLRESRCKSILSRLTTMGMMRSVCSRMKSLQLRGCRVNLATLHSHRMSPAKRAYRLFHTNLKLQASSFKVHVMHLRNTAYTSRVIICALSTFCWRYEATQGKAADR